MKRLTLLIPLIFCVACHKNVSSPDGDMISMQFIDRNGFSETISTGERLKSFHDVNFLSPQPYQKVMRVFDKQKSSASKSIITSYHDNGQIYQYLEIKEGRAFGGFKQWHPNGKLQIESTVIEGLPDTTQIAFASWIFDGVSRVYDENGDLEAEIFYQNGDLVECSNYYYSDGALRKRIPYEHNLIHGTVEEFDRDGKLIKVENYEKGLKSGSSFSKWENGRFASEEEFVNDCLITATYRDKNGKFVSEIKKGNGHLAQFNDEYLTTLIEIRKGKPEGVIKYLDEKGHVTSSYSIKDGVKNGEEWEYFPVSDTANQLRQKLFLFWREDQIQESKTWYPSGQQQSQSEMHANQKHGMSLAWYPDGAVMYVEEYDHGKITKATYYKRNQKEPVSKILDGEGTAHIYDEHGHLLDRIKYEKGEPFTD